MIALLLLYSISCLASQPIHWSHVVQISDKHEFYKNNEKISKPKDSWQHLFSLIYMNKKLDHLKDCVFYKVPGLDVGTLKIKTISAFESCEPFLLTQGDREITEIKELIYGIWNDHLTIDISFLKTSPERWLATIESSYTRPVPKMYLSSSDFKHPKIIFLANVASNKKNNLSFLPQDSICHDINEDCAENSAFKCDQCKQGWYEVPNGCLQGPKYCGDILCGQKNMPACRRGMKWQRKNQDFDCRTNSSFAYCAKGLKIQCEGQKAYCR